MSEIDRLKKIEATLPLIDKSIELRKQQIQKLYELRLALARELHDKSPVFWLDDVRGKDLTDIYKEYVMRNRNAGYDMPISYGISLVHEAKEWKERQRLRWLGERVRNEKRESKEKPDTN